MPWPRRDRPFDQEAVLISRNWSLTDSPHQERHAWQPREPFQQRELLQAGGCWHGGYQVCHSGSTKAVLRLSSSITNPRSVGPLIAWQDLQWRVAVLAVRLWSRP